jgi:hypothetical protein
MTSGFVRAADVDKSDINVAPPRNIVYILSDDLGYGDLGCYGATKVKTPNLDRLAAEGIRFTDAYAPSSVCSPSRYAILTGRFFWRTTNDCEVLANDAPFHAGLDRTTVPSLLKSAGYKTGGVGKWHLGIGTAEHTDWNAPLKPGPLEAGFDYFFGMPSNLLLVPPVYIENHGIANQDPNTKIVITGKGKNAVATGITDVRRDIEAAPRFAAKAIEFIEKSKDTPFFLYFATNIVHDPIVPAPQFQGTSQAGPYGDFIQQLDRPEQGHAGDLHQRQRRGGAAAGRVNSTRPGQGDQDGPGHQRRAARRETFRLRGRFSHSLHRTLAGKNPGGGCEPRHYQYDRSAGDDVGPRP